MGRDVNQPLGEQLVATQAWWRDAGVDCAFTDEATHWLREDEPEAPKPVTEAAPTADQATAAPPKTMIGGNPGEWPKELAEFRKWWLAEPSLDAGGVQSRIAPRGSAGAKLMVLVPEPENEDREEFLSGPLGNLLKNFLRSADVAEEDVYFASALPRHTPLPDWQALGRDGLGEIVLHHIALVGPERLLVFGRDLLTIIRHDPPKSPAFLLNLNHQGSSVPGLAARSLETMLKRPSTRPRFWQHWLEWTDG